MPRAQQIGANVFATPQEIAGGFFLLGRNVNRGQRAGAIEDRELAGIAAIGLDAIAGPPRNQRRRDDVTRDAVRGQRPLQLEAAGPGLVAALHRRPGAAAARRTAESSGYPTSAMCSAGVRWPGNKHRGHRRGGVLIEGNRW